MKDFNFKRYTCSCIRSKERPKFAQTDFDGRLQFISNRIDELIHACFHRIILFNMARFFGKLLLSC